MGREVGTKRLDFRFAQHSWVFPLVAVTVKTEELNDPMAVGLLRRQGVVERTHLVAKLVEEFPVLSDADRLHNARKWPVIRRIAAFADACIGGWLA